MFEYASASSCLDLRMTRLYTLGRFELCDRDGVPFHVQPKRLALLAYLAAAASSGPVRRDTVLGLFWPELGQAEARRALRQALHYLRRFAGADAIAARADDQLALTAAVECDVVQVQRCIAASDDEGALRQYGGDFLAGVFLAEVAPEFDEWLERTRARLRASAAAAAWRLSERSAAAGDAAAAAVAALRALELVPDDEGALRRALDVLVQIGDRGRALRVYESWSQRLAREFDATPAAETVALIERIRAESHHPRTAAGAAPAPLATEHADDAAVPDAAARTAPVAARAARIATRSPPAVSRVLPVAASLAVVLALSAILTVRARAPETVAGDDEESTVVVADLTSSLSDSALVRALGEIVRVDLAQSRGLRVLSPTQVRTVLQRMTLAPDALLTDSITRELAVREGVKAIVSGEVSQVAGRYLLSVRLVSAADGTLLAAARETADSTDLVAAAGRLTRVLRLQLGESLRSVRSTPPLSSVTTPSLPALRAYSDAMVESEERGDRIAAIALLDRAVELDSGFAAAYRMLGSLHSSQADPGRSQAALARAIEFRDRLPLRERYLTLGSYHRNVTREYDKSIAAYRALLELYPRNVPALNNLSLVHAEQRAHAQAERLLLRAISIDSTIAILYFGLGQALINQGRFTEAQNVLETVERRFPGNVAQMLTWTYLNAARQDWSEAERHIRRRLENARANGRAADEADALQTLGQIQLLTGRVRAAEPTLRESRAIAHSLGIPRRVLFTTVQLAWLELRYRDRPARALALVDSVLVAYPLDGVASGDRPYRELAELLAALGARDHLRRFQAIAVTDSAARLDVDGAPGRALSGFAAAAAGRQREAIRDLRLVDATERCPICVLPALGDIYERTGDSEAAVAAYRRYVDTPWMWRFEPDAPHLGWTMLRLIDLYRRAGRDAEAAAVQARLDGLWRNADPEVRALLTQPSRGA
jgi:DNA-binding SARP family transcriptional activator/tetratricopeptide (TPR) repeat protein